MATKILSIKRKDKITTLNHITGNINLAAGAILSIGGLQYTTDAVKTVALPTLTAHIRYQIYAVVSGGDVILVISTSENSLGPAGYTSWKLVGSFYANGSTTVGFGGFLTITGVPTVFVQDSADLSSNFTGFGALVVSQYNWSRVGKRFKANIRLDSVTGTGSTAAFSILSGALGLTTVEANNRVGTFAGQNGGGNAGGGSMIGLAGSIYFAGPSGLSGAAVSVISGNQVVGAGAPSTIVIDLELNITQWSNTPIEDL